jgi:hypothetical protein
VDIADLLRFAVAVFELQGVPYMLVGSLASIAYGEPRLTNDIDIVADLKPIQVDAFCSAFPDGEFYVSLAAARDAVQRGHQFNVIHYASACKLDVMAPRRDAWGQSQLANRKRRKILPNLECYTASPEDVILGKLWYYQVGESEKHLRDIAGILQVSDAEVNRVYIAEWASRLNLVGEWQLILDRLDRDAS